MKRELFAAALLAALVLGAVWNLTKLDSLVGAVRGEIVVSRSCAESGQFEQARIALKRGREIWTQAGAYTEIFLRHPELDAIADAFCELEERLEEETGGFAPCYARLLYHLDCIDRMEHLRPGSIL